MMNRIYRRCSCMNNEQNNLDETIETSYNNVDSCEDYTDNCMCGFDSGLSKFPENPSYGQSYVPIQHIEKTFIPKVGLKMGTIFPELVKPYLPGQSMQEINYIEETNEPGEGCNV